MSVKLIAEKILTVSEFLSATEQEGEYIEQPIPNSANDGDFRLLSTGEIADFTYSGTATGNGTTLTMVDSVLAIYGDNYFIGGTITFTGGANGSGSKTITDFAQATGTITWVGAVNATLIGDTFTLTVAFATRDFRVELVAGGDAGDATFKWSHDGGTTYLGRDDPDQASWLGERTISAAIVGANLCIEQAANGNLICCYESSVDNTDYYTISTDRGATWGAGIPLSGVDRVPYDLVRLSNDRILFFTSNYLHYSDDHGVLWSTGIQIPESFHQVVELFNGSLLGVWRQAGLGARCRVSNDGGVTWSDAVTINPTATAFNRVGVCQANNGDVIAAYESSTGSNTIECNISSDNGVTWGTAITVQAVAGNYESTRLIRDIDGRIICLWVDETNGDIDFAVSSDNGATWGATKTLHNTANNLTRCDPALVDGHEIVVAIFDSTATEAVLVRRGMWEAFAANACQCAAGVLRQMLICNVFITWAGGSGVAADSWQFEAAYSYAMSNLIEDSPSKPWRSEQDNIVCNIVIDMGANVRFFADGISFFGCNMRTLSFQMNATDAWVGPSIDESISFDLVTGGVVDSVAGNYVEDAALFADYKDHELEGYFLRMTSGTDNGETWEIADNVEDYIILDTTAATNIAQDDTFIIFQKWIAYTFTNTVPYRFMRIAIDAQQTSDGYYQIGTMVVGRTVVLGRRWTLGYGKSHIYDIRMLETPDGGLIPVRGAKERRVFNLSWPHSDSTRNQFVHLLDHIQGNNISLVPDHGTLTDCYLVKLIGDAEQVGGVRDHFDLVLTLGEIL